MYEPKIEASEGGHDKKKDKYRELKAIGREIGKELSKGSKEMSRRLADIETSNSKRQTIPQLANGHRDKLSQLKLDSSACAVSYTHLRAHEDGLLSRMPSSA